MEQSVDAAKQKRHGRLTFLLILLCSLLSLFAVFFWFHKDLTSRILETNYQFLEENSYQQSVSVRTKLNGQFEQLILYSRIFETLDMRDYTAVKCALNTTNGFGAFKRISIANEIGVVTNNDNTASGNILKTDYFNRAMQGETCITLHAEPDTDGEKIFTLSVPIYQKEAIVGVLLGAFNRTDLEELLTENVFDGAGASFIMEQNGAVILSSSRLSSYMEGADFLAFLQNRAVLKKSDALSDFRSALSASETGILEYQFEERSIVAQYRPTGINDWYLVSLVDSSFITEQSSHISLHVLLMVAYIFCIFCTIFLYLYHIVKQQSAMLVRNETLRLQAEHDPLTALLNKVSVENYIVSRLTGGKETWDFALYIIDVDNFKQINDTYGHSFGDKALEAVADNLRSIFSAQDYLGRIGGDEFLAFLDLRSCPEEERLQVTKEKAEALCSSIRCFCADGYENHRISVSIGVAIYGAHGMTFSDLYRNADKALYIAKDCGKDTYAILPVADIKGGAAL